MWRSSVIEVIEGAYRKEETLKDGLLLSPFSLCIASQAMKGIPQAEDLVQVIQAAYSACKEADLGRIRVDDMRKQIASGKMSSLAGALSGKPQSDQQHHPYHMGHLYKDAKKILMVGAMSGGLAQVSKQPKGFWDDRWLSTVGEVLDILSSIGLKSIASGKEADSKTAYRVVVLSRDIIRCVTALDPNVDLSNKMR